MKTAEKKKEIVILTLKSAMGERSNTDLRPFFKRFPRDKLFTAVVLTAIWILYDLYVDTDFYSSKRPPCIIYNIYIYIIRIFIYRFGLKKTSESRRVKQLCLVWFFFNPFSTSTANMHNLYTFQSITITPSKTFELHNVKNAVSAINYLMYSVDAQYTHTRT